MSTAVNQHWNRHYRALKDTTTMPATAERSSINDIVDRALQSLHEEDQGATGLKARRVRSRKLKDAAMALPAGLPEPATPDPLDPEVLALVQAANSQWLSRQAARDAHVEEVQRALAEEPVAEQDEEPEAPSFTRLSAHGVACEVAIVLVTPEIAQRYLKNQARNRNMRRRQIEFLVRELRDSRGT
jgi:hypothetical protein